MSRRNWKDHEDIPFLVAVVVMFAVIGAIAIAEAVARGCP